MVLESPKPNDETVILRSLMGANKMLKRRSVRVIRVLSDGGGGYRVQSVCIFFNESEYIA